MMSDTIDTNGIKEEELYYTAKEVMHILGIKTYGTLSRWEKLGFLKTIVKPNGRKMYLKSIIDKYKGE